MTINHETEVVASRYEDTTRTCHYTVARNGKRWTVAVPLEHLDNAAKPHRDNAAKLQARRNHLARVFQQAMNGPHDVA